MRVDNMVEGLEKVRKVAGAMGNFLEISWVFRRKTGKTRQERGKITDGDEKSLSCVTTHESIDKRQLSRLMSNVGMGTREH